MDDLEPCRGRFARGDASADGRDDQEAGRRLSRVPPVATRGLTHIALSVRDPKRSYAFYRAVLGVEKVYEDEGFLQAQTPGSRDVLVFQKAARRRRGRGGVLHFGFRLVAARDIERAVRAVRAAGGTIRSRGEFCPGEPFVFFEDPDGYEVEIWHELPTPVDPREKKRRRSSKEGS